MKNKLKTKTLKTDCANLPCLHGRKNRHDPVESGYPEFFPGYSMAMKIIM
jgi:hypothetical protein